MTMTSWEEAKKVIVFKPGNLYLRIGQTMLKQNCQPARVFRYVGIRHRHHLRIYEWPDRQAFRIRSAAGNFEVAVLGSAHREMLYAYHYPQSFDASTGRCGWSVSQPQRVGCQFR
jgi:hypothetical protein